MSVLVYGIKSEVIMAVKSDTADPGMEDLTAALNSLWKGGRGADLTVVCGPITLKVHSILVCERSKFFAASCKDGFMESQTKRIELHDDEPHLVLRMFQYCYGTDYIDNKPWNPDGTINAGGFVPPLPINAKMYAVADKYDMQGLKKKAELKFKNGLTKIVEIHAVTRDISQLFTAIPIVYTTTPDSDRALRDAIAIFAAENWTRLLTVPEFKTCMEENIDFVIDVVAKTMLCRENCNHCIVSDAGGRIRG